MSEDYKVHFVAPVEIFGFVSANTEAEAIELCKQWWIERNPSPEEYDIDGFTGELFDVSPIEVVGVQELF